MTPHIPYGHPIHGTRIDRSPGLKRTQLPMNQRAVITLGPSYEPIDDARRLTNFSTGALGTQLAKDCVLAGIQVDAYRGVGATAPFPDCGATLIPFTTNASLISSLQDHPAPESVSVVFHVAALCDYVVDAIQDADGDLLRQKKIATQDGSLWMRLQPAPKVFAHLRNLFPRARVCGWKYELNGDRDAALDKGRAQMRHYHSSACVVNGAAYGEGFGVLLDEREPPLTFPDAASLTHWLANAWVSQSASSLGSASSPAT